MTSDTFACPLWLLCWFGCVPNVLLPMAVLLLNASPLQRPNGPSLAAYGLIPALCLPGSAARTCQQHQEDECNRAASHLVNNLCVCAMEMGRIERKRLVKREEREGESGGLERLQEWLANWCRKET